MSDDEAEVDDSENTATPRRDASSSAISYHERLRSGRQDPVRQSISALSGVTIIGRGSISSNRDSIGSISTIGSSNRNSIDDSSRPNAMSRAQSENITSSTRSGTPATSKESLASTSASSDQSSGPIDMPSALQLLQMYPRSASPPHNFDDSRIKQQHQQPRQSEEPPQPARSRSMSPRSGTSPCTRDAAPLYTTSEEEGGSRPVRRHSRSSMASELLMSPTMGMSQIHQRSTSPTSERFSHQYSSLYTHGGQPLSAKALSDAVASISSLPQASSSQTISSMASGGSSPKRAISASRSISSNDIAQIVRSFNSRSRKATGRRRSTQGQPLDEGGHFPSHTISTDSSATTDTTTTATSHTTTTAPENSSSRRSRRVSRHPSNSNLKDLIKQKRRQASAPFHTSASVDTSGATSPILASGAQSPVRSHPPVPAEAHPSTWDSIAQRRARSRRSSAVSQALQLGFSPTGFEEARLRALRGMGEVVMTPSVEVSCHSARISDQATLMQHAELPLLHLLSNRNGGL